MNRPITIKRYTEEQHRGEDNNEQNKNDNKEQGQKNEYD